MIKKTLSTLLLSTFAVMALETGDAVPQAIQDELKLENNQTYVIDFFASWCKSCKKELPLVEKVAQENVTHIIGVNVDKKEEDGKKFVADLGLTFPIIYDNDKKLVEAFDPMGFPAIYYVKDGKVLNVIFGAVDDIDEQIKKDMQELK